MCIRDRIMTTLGECGMLVCDDDELWKSAWAYKDHGKGYDTVYDGVEHDGVSFRWLHDSFGTNWRMTEVQAAQGRVALAKVPRWVESRRANAAVLNEGIEGIAGLSVVEEPEYAHGAFYKYYALVDTERLVAEWSRDRIALAVRAEGVPCGVGACPDISRERAFVDAGLAPFRRLDGAASLGSRSIMLTLHPTCTDAEMRDAVAALAKVMGEAVR